MTERLFAGEVAPGRRWLLAKVPEVPRPLPEGAEAVAAIPAGLSDLIGAVTAPLQQLNQEQRQTIRVLERQLDASEDQLRAFFQVIGETQAPAEQQPARGPSLSELSVIWRGMAPTKQRPSGGKERVCGISKRGDQYLRWLLVAESLAVIRYAQRHGTRRLWLVKLLERRSTKIAAVALANKIARIAWW